MSNNDFKDFGFGDGDDNVGRKSEKFKGEQGRTYRVSFVWWPGLEDGKPDLDAKTPRFRSAKRFYFEGVGYVLDGGPEFAKVAGEAPRLSVATAIVVWPTDSKGQIDKARFLNGDSKVLPWIFSGDKFMSFKPVHQEFPFGSHDLTISCTDTKYQKMTFSPCRDSLLRKLLEKDGAKDHVKDIISQAQEVVANIGNEIGRAITLDQLREKLGGVPAGAPAGSSAGSNADIDSLVDDILDE